MNKILGELLSANCEDLEGDRAINILQERLQIKPINLEKLCLPDLEAIPTMNLKSSSRNLSKRSLISVDNHLQRTETLKSKQDDETLVNPVSTPSSIRSPLGSLSALNRRISLSNSSVGIAEQSSVSKLKSLLTKDGGTVANGIKSSKILFGDADSMSKISSSSVLNVPQVGGDTALSGTHASMEAKDDSGSTEVEVNEKFSCLEAQADVVANMRMEDLEGSASEQPNSSMVDVIKEYPVGTQGQLDQSTATCTENIVDGLSRSSGTNHHVEMENHEGLASEQPNLSKVDVIKEYPVGIQSQLDESTATCTENIVDGSSRSSETNHHNEEQVKPKSRANKQRKGKKISGRQSLAGAGTTWQSGVRRSTRFKTRPLEYWKGERLLYGRVHESLATVIGLKYVSPAKGNGQPTLKVKSLVSNEYKDLVELAALH